MYQNFFLQKLKSFFKLQVKKSLILMFMGYFSFLSAEGKYQYKILDLGTLSLCQSTHFIDFNDKGQVVLSCHLEKEDKGSCCGYNDTFGLWDIHKGFTFLSLEEGVKINEIEKINNQGWMIGKANKKNRKLRERSDNEETNDASDESEKYDYTATYDCPIIWDAQAQKLIFLAEKVKLIDINDHNQVLGYDKEKGLCFIFENQEYKYLDLAKEIQQHGIHPSNLFFLKMNKRGEILGRFEYGVKHPYKDKWRSEGEQYFLWNGQIHLIDRMIGDRYHRPSFFLTDQSEVFFRLSEHSQRETYKWDPINGTQIYDTKNSPPVLNFKNLSHTMHYSIEQNHRNYIVRQNGKVVSIIDLSVEETLSLFDKSLYPNIEFNSLEQINDRGQIIMKGQVWNETHYFLLDPIIQSRFSKLIDSLSPW